MTEETSLDWKERAYEDPIFVMLGSTKQIAEIIKKNHYSQMTAEEKAKFEQFQSTDFLYVHPFDHGVSSDPKVYDRKDPNDPSMAAWVLKGKAGPNNRDLTWEFDINWGTLRFKETITTGSDSLLYFGSCELVNPYELP